MYIKNIFWMDEMSKEAIVIVSDGNNDIRAFCDCCNYQYNDQLSDSLNSLSEENIQKNNNNTEKIEALDDNFKYLIFGEIIKKTQGLIKVNGFLITIDETKLPHDLNDGDHISFITNRIDLWDI